MQNERTHAVESVLKQLSELVTALSLDEMMFLSRNSVICNHLSSTFCAGMQVELNIAKERIAELEGLLASHEQQLESEQISKGNLIRELSAIKQQSRGGHGWGI